MSKIYKDSLHRIAYATDASIYREIPLGVSYPESEQEIINLIAEARNLNTHIIPRAGGTSIAGQVVGSGIVADISKNLNKIIEIDRVNRIARLQPGVVRDELNVALKPYGLFFSPETSTSNRCCIGGMMGNNSCGTHSLIYGSTRHHVIAAKGVLSDGTMEEFRELSIHELEERFGSQFWNKNEHVLLIEKIYSQLITFALNKDICNIIDESYPDKSLRRRSCGYAIDEVIEDLRDNTKDFKDRTINLCKLLSGSEGTLVFITEITVSLDVLPSPHAMMLCAHCDTLQKCFDANLAALDAKPDAIELIDRPILKLSEDNISQRENRFFISGNPAGILCIELREESEELLIKKKEYLLKSLHDSGLVYHVSEVQACDINRVYGLRKAGLGLLNGMKGDAKPIGVIEDTAIAPRRLGGFISDLDEMLSGLGLDCVYYGHISTGELHLRPIINIKEEKGREQFYEVALETAKLVKKHKGSLSGEHGDGRLRGEFIPLVYGEDAYRLMKEIKKIWDPNGIFNIGKITDTPPMNENLRYDLNQKYALELALPEDKTYFNWRAAFDECDTPGASGVESQSHALMCSVEQCNGAGDCRKSNIIGGTMCPAFKVSADEMKTTRARSNVLREILTRGDSNVADNKVLTSNGIKTVLDSCLACKGCRSECPSNVDMTRIRAELLQHRYDSLGTPLNVHLISRMSTLSHLAMIAPQIYNLLVSWDWSSKILKRVLRFATERNIPRLCRYTMRHLVNTEIRMNKYHITKGKVYLFADEFTDTQESELGLMFAKLLCGLGYEVIVPKHTESGRAAISKGILRHAKRCANENVALLHEIINQDNPLVGIEPSCILTFRDEYSDLVDPKIRPVAKKLGTNALLYDEFLLREINAGRISADDFKECPQEIWLHGHCHQKALVGIDKTKSILEGLLKTKVNVIPSGCCGMAGSFGYEKEHYNTSMAIGEMVLFPTLRYVTSNRKEAIVSAPGTSCRHQIKEGTGITAYHPIELLIGYCKL